MDSLTFFLVVMFSLSASLVQVQGTRMGNETDRAALLEFRSQIHDDPDRIFSSWNDSIDFCRWPGVTCGRRHPRVTRLELPGSRLMGSLSPYIGNLSFLKVIDINNNSFSGEIPPEIGNLHRLIAVFLDNNSFSGPLPENISGCTNLQVITVQNSMLGGEIPRGLAALSELRAFQIYHNNFTGKFPDFFGNFSYLKTMAADYNQFVGTIPASLGQMKKLQYFLLGGNFFSGTVPLSIFNITSLAVMELGLNQLEGHLPWDLGITLPNLNYLSVSGNHLTGLLPPSISNATNLQVLQININNFSGPVPDLNNLNLLQWLDIAFNQLGSGKSGDLRFVELINSTELLQLDFRSNFLGGSLPQSIGNISSNLNLLEFDFNQLTGTIPSSIGNLRKLETLTTSENPLTGRLPDEIGNLHNLKILIMMNCSFSGKIPSLLGNLTMLIILSLAGNKLQGSIPESLGKCQNLMELDLNGNNLSGAIPSQLLSISSLSSNLDLSWNKLTGALPDQIGSLTNLESLDVQENRLSGRVPNTLSQCISLEKLSMGNNLFEGNITSFLRPLRGLQYLDLSQNNFSGQIPEFLGTFQLRYLNLSFNRFEGKVPNQGVFLNSSAVAVKGNERLCGGILELHLPSCLNPKSMPRRKISSKVITATACGIALMFILLSFLALSICMRKHRRRKQFPNSHLVLGGFFPQISYEDILRATEGLDKNNLIGTGYFGSVYKGILRDCNNMVAIKVLNLQTGAASKSFLAECEALRNIRHRNLVKILTACSTIDFQGNDFKALVYEYMENGSLDVWLHHTAEGVHRNLSLIQRLSIANDIACAVEYLHHESEMPIIHCDLKPSNILLDMEMTAHVGDFGLARILPTAEVVLQVSSVGVRGTIGYSPPEYGMGSPMSKEGDVYSYGILLLEMFTGKRPTDNMFENGWNIRYFCEAALPDRVGEITDPSLFSNLLGEGSSIPASTRAKECLVKVFEVGISCCQELPRERMDIRDASAKLRSIKAALL